MALKTRATGFTRFLLLLLLMAAIFFGTRYALESTAWGKKVQNDLIEAAK